MFRALFYIATSPFIAATLFSRFFFIMLFFSSLFFFSPFLGSDLRHQRALQIGVELRAKGVNFFLGPVVVSPLGRIAKAGRNCEGYSNDPDLSGALATETVRGIQYNRVVTSTKRCIGNEQGKRKKAIDGFCFC